MNTVAENDPRLVLGTAQLGMAYGIANKGGQPETAVAEAIISTAWEGGVRIFDTAQAYGDSETVLGKTLVRLGLADQARVCTKVLSMDDFEVRVRESVKRLGSHPLHCLMLHDERCLIDWANGTGERLEALRRNGLIHHVGVSAYSPRIAREALRRDEVSMIQVPGNVMDRRFETAGVFELARELGKEVHVRSVFMQGLFFFDFEDRERRDAFQYLDYDRAERYVRQVRELACDAGLSIQQFALAWVRRAYGDAYVLVGAETPTQVAENLEGWNAPLPEAVYEKSRTLFKGVGPEILHIPYWANGPASLDGIE